jgi:hypothetical protein
MSTASLHCEISTSLYHNRGILSGLMVECLYSNGRSLYGWDMAETGCVYMGGCALFYLVEVCMEGGGYSGEEGHDGQTQRMEGMPR